MALRRKKVSRGPRSAASHESPPPPPLLFQALISALQSPLCPKAPLLKRLRALLMCFSLRTLDSSCPVNVIPQEDICKLSEILYEELRERSHQLFSALREISISQKHARTLSSSKLWNNVEDLPLLLRCCSSVLTLLSFDQNLILEKARVLRSILSKLISFTSSGNDEGTSISFKSFHRECSYSENGYTTSVAEDLVASLHFLQPSDPHWSLLSALLEVFADELLLEESLRGLFVSVDSAFSPGEQLFRCNGNHHNVEVVLELMAAHLMLLDSNEEAIENILSRIDGYQWKGIKIPELSLTAALALLVNPIGPSVPKMLQAHLVLLVSEVMDARTFSLSTGPDLTEMDLYLKAFERSVNLYKMHMCNFHGGRHAPSAEDPFPFSCLLGKIQPSFQSCIKQVTKEKLELFVAKLENSWNSYGRNMILESKTDMLSGSLAYIRNLCDVVNWSDKDEILSVLECVILKVFNREPSHSVPHKNGGVSFQDVYLLSSILKLMSNSMFQVIWLFRKNGYTSCLHTSQDLSFQRQHNFLLEVVCCFQQFGNHLPVQHFLFERMKVHKLRHEECTGTLLHFLGLLSLCFDTRFDFLVKACLSMIMVLLNLIILEEGDLVAVRSLLALERESSSHGFFSKEEIPMADNSTQKVASTFQKIQRQCLRTVPARCLRSNVQEVQGGCSNIASGPNHTESFCVEESTEETCNGEIFLKCLLEGSKKSCDYGDLVDFIELKKGKDYIGWLRNRVKYRKRKSERMAVLRWKKKKMTWRMMKGKKS